MRGIGALFIVVGHFALTKSFRSAEADAFLIDLLQVLAVAGVSCFFTLSGFVLTWASPRRVDSGAFWRNRVARLFPVHAVMWAGGLFTLVAAGLAPELSKMIPSLLLVNVWFPDLQVFWGANTPSWTLAVEAFFYALFPFLLVQLWKVPEHRLWQSVGAVVSLMALWALVVGLVVSATPDVFDGKPLSRAQYFAVVSFAPVRLLDFVLGILLARIVIAGRVPGRLRPWLYISLIAGYVIARWVIPQPLGFIVAMVPAVIVGLVYSASADVAGRASRWSTPTLLWFGERSFALYLVHWPVLFGLHRALGDPEWDFFGAIVFGAVAIFSSIAIAHLLHTRVEVPLYRRYGRRRIAQVGLAEVASAPTQAGRPPALS